MKIKNSSQDFGLLTRLLHWFIALLIIFLIWLGWYMVDLSYYDRWYHDSLTWHKALGMIVLMLAIIKIGWQLYSPTPAVHGDLKVWEKIGATVMHKILFLMMLLIPITGYLISTSDGKSIDMFGWFEIPALISNNTTLRDWAIELHFYMAYGLALLLLAHIGAALKHQFIDKDSTLTRMLWK